MAQRRQAMTPQEHRAFIVSIRPDTVRRYILSFDGWMYCETAAAAWYQHTGNGVRMAEDEALGHYVGESVPVPF